MGFTKKQFLSGEKIAIRCTRDTGSSIVKFFLDCGLGEIGGAINRYYFMIPYDNTSYDFKDNPYDLEDIGYQLFTMNDLVEEENFSINNLKQSENGSECKGVKLQRVVGIVTNGEKRVGQPVQGKSSKVAIGVRFLGNKAIVA